MNELSSFFDRIKNKRYGSSEREECGSVSPTDFIITVLLRGSQIQSLISKLEKNENTCSIRSSFFLNDASIPSGSRIMTIQGYVVANKSLAFTTDLLYILRNREIVTIQFSPLDSPILSEVSQVKTEVSLSQCILFLLSHYSVIASLSKKDLSRVRPNVIRNHYITLQQLNHRNHDLVLDDILCPSDIEHILVVERLFIHSVKTLFPQPIIYKSYIQSLYDGTQYKPTLEQIRILLKRIPSPCLLPLGILFRFYECIYQQFNEFPTNEITPLICEGANLEVMTTLILTSPQLIKDQRELWLSGCMLEWLSGKWDADFCCSVPEDAQQVRSSSLLAVLQDCSTKTAVQMILETNLSINVTDILQAGLLLLSGERDGLFGDWFVSIAKTIPEKESQFNRVNQLRSIVQMLPFAQRCCLFWLMKVLQATPSSQSEVLKTIARTLIPKKADWMEGFLQVILQHVEFVFIPSIPNSTCQLNATDLMMGILPTVITDIVFPSFTMHTSFLALHEDVQKNTAVESDAELLMKYYKIAASYTEPRVIHSSTIRWNTPYSQVVRSSN